MGISFTNAPGSYDFWTAGKDHMMYWDFNAKKGKNCVFGKGEQTSFGCCTSDINGTCYAGGANSKIYLWKGNAFVSTLNKHNKGFIAAI